MSKRDIEYKLALVLAAAAVLLVVHVKSAAADFDFIRFSRFVNKYSDILIDYRKESLGILQRAKVERDTVMNEEYDTIKEDIDAEQDRLRELKIFVDFRRLVTEENLRAYNSMLYDELAYIERLRANDLMYERR